MCNKDIGIKKVTEFIVGKRTCHPHLKATTKNLLVEDGCP